MVLRLDGYARSLDLVGTRGARRGLSSSTFTLSSILIVPCSLQIFVPLYSARYNDDDDDDDDNDDNDDKDDKDDNDDNDDYDDYADHDDHDDHDDNDDNDDNYDNDYNDDNYDNDDNEARKLLIDIVLRSLF